MRKAKSRGGRRRNFDVHPPSSIIRKRKAVIESDEEDMNHGTGDRDHTHPSKRRLLSALQQPLGDHLTGDAQPRNITLSPPPPLRRSERNRLIWSCKTEGCDYQVDTADKPDGIAKVRAHMLQHADEIAEREALILEESKPYLPTSRLLEMLRSLGESAQSHQDSSRDLKVGSNKKLEALSNNVAKELDLRSVEKHKECHVCRAFFKSDSEECSSCGHFICAQCGVISSSISDSKGGTEPRTDSIWETHDGELPRHDLDEIVPFNASMSPWTQIAIFNDYQGMPYEIEVLFDTGSTSNFITEKIALELGLPLLPLSPRDVKAFTTLQGAEFSPGSYLTTSVRLFKSDSPEDSSNSKVSFRVVDTNKIDLPVPILGYPYIIENRLFERTLVESVTPLKRQPAILGERTPQAEATLDEATLDGSIIHGSPPPVSGWPPMNTPFEQQSVKCVSHVDQATDSGYHSGRGTDLASQYSAATSLSIILTHDTLSEFVDFFANALVHGKDFSSWFSVIQVTLSPALLLQRLDEILKSYAIAASKDAHLELERNALVLVRQHRRQIIQRMTDSSQPISENFNRLKALFKDISLKDKMESWRSGFIKPQAGGEPLDRLTLEKDQSDEEDEAYIEGGDVEFAAVSSFLTQGPHFRLLLQDIKRLYYDRDLKLIETQSAVFDGLRLQEPGEHGRYRASIQLNSDMSRFLEGQFGQNSNQALGSVITLTGSGLYAQATTCTEYVEQNWPVLGVQVLGVLEAALKDGPCHESFKFPVSSVSLTKVEISVTVTTTCTVDICGSKETIAQIVQLLAWIGSALQVSNTERIQLRSSRIRFYGGNKFDLTFANTDLHETEQSCWYALFSNPVIAHAWPIPGRDNDEIGLDITVRLMAALAGATHAFDFEGGFVLKGFSAMLVPIKSYSNSTQWHLIQNEKGGHIDYAEVRSQCPERALLAEVNLESLLSKRAFLGWWKAADTLLGTADVAYAEIAYSGVKPPGRSAKISGASLGFSQYLSGAATFGFGRKDGRLHISRTGGLKQILDYAEEVPVCLYDSVGKRGWLGAATDALLHIACAKQKEKAFVIDNVPISFTYADPHSHGHKASRNAMTKMKSLILEVGGKTGGGDFCFGDLIEELWAVLDRLGAESSVVEDAPGITVKLTLEGKLQGWELMDLVRPVSDFCPRKTVLRATHGGWSDLIPDISAIVLFASGLGEVIRPRVEDKGLCALWRTMPKGKDYLAASIPILEKLHKRTGPPKNHKYMLSHRLCWHSPSIIFESCAESKRSNSCTCYRLQELIPDSFTTVGNIKAPYTPLVQEGCVIFGRAEHPLVRALRERRNKKTTANGIFKQPNKVFLEEPREPSSPSSTSSEGSHFPKILSPDDGKHHEPSCRNVSRRQGLRSTTTTAVLENRRKRQRSKEFELTKEEESSLSETSLAYSQQRPQCRHMSKNKIPRLRQAGRASTNREEKSNVYVSSNLLPRQQGNSNLGLQKPAPKLRRRGSAYDLHGSAQENYSNHECFASESRPEGNMVNESFNLKNKGEIELVRLNVSAKEKRS